MQDFLNETILCVNVWLCIESKLCTIKTFVEVKVNSTTGNAVNLLTTFYSSLGFEPWTPCMQASALAISTTEAWLTGSLNQWLLLITKALRTTSIGCHLFVIASCQSQLLIAMHTKSRWLYLYLVNITNKQNYLFLL